METSALLLRFGIGLLFAVFGAHKIIHPFAWIQWLPHEVVKLLPTSESAALIAHGVTEAFIGIILMSGLLGVMGTWLAFAWMITVLPFAFHRDWQIGMRDLALAFCLLALVFLQN